MSPVPGEQGRVEPAGGQAVQWDRHCLAEVGKRCFWQVVQRDDVSGLAAELAYRFFLAIFPFFIFLGALSGFIAALLQVENPGQEIVRLLGDTLPPEATRLIEPQLQAIVGTRHPNLLSIGILTAIFFATGGTNAVIKAMNRAYDVHETRPFWRRYLLALGLTLLAGSALLAGWVLLVVRQLFGRHVAGALGLAGPFDLLLGLGRWPLVVLLVFVATTVIYRATPNIHLKLRWVLPGAVLFTLSWVGATYLFSLYVANFASYNATYGALGGFAILLIWFYLTAFILLVGAELNSVLDEIVDPDDVQAQRSQTKAQAAQRQPAPPDPRPRAAHQAR